MRFHFNEQRKIFHLSTPEMSYAFGIDGEGRLVHLYWGRALLSEESLAALAVPDSVSAWSRGVADEGTEPRFEVPTLEPGDYTAPVLRVIQPDGVRSLRLTFRDYRLEGDELTIRLRDRVYPVSIDLCYKGWGDLPLLSRSLTVRNEGTESITLQDLGCAAWYLPYGRRYRLTHFSGSWGSEYSRNRIMLSQARTVLQNNRLTCASAQQLPFFLLDMEGKTTETDGEAYFGMIHWSGDFRMTVEEQYGRRVSVTGQCHSDDFRYVLCQGEQIETPLFTAGLTVSGFEHMSEVLYDWQLDHLLPKGGKADKAHAPRPVLYNSWYPYQFDVREDNCLALIEKCAGLGIELFVLDDGWMPGRTNDRKGLGDWTADPNRFPRGLKPLSDACHRKGMLFGLWVEPEMLNPDSDLFRTHPDWVLRDPTRPNTLQRGQIILNLARDDVRDWVISVLDRLIEENGLDYLKWDMNRYVSENGWPEALPEDRQSVSFRYIRNLRAIWENLNARWGNLLLENCASGGGRADFGMVPFADRMNRSDNADPVDVMLLHEGFTTLFPPKTAGGAGTVAPETHHVHGRTTPLPFRLAWGLTGSMGIGINLLTADSGTLSELKSCIGEYKRLRGDLQNAYVYRIASAEEHPYALFQYVRRDRKTFTLFAFAHGMRNWDRMTPAFRMRGLLPEEVYVCEDGRRMTGESLMNFGLNVSLKGDECAVVSTWRVQSEIPREAPAKNKKEE